MTMSEKQIVAHLHRSAKQTFEEFLEHCATEVTDMMIGAQPYASPIEHMLAIALRAKLATLLFADRFTFCALSSISVEKAADLCKLWREINGRAMIDHWGGIFRQVTIGAYRVDFILLHVAGSPARYSGIVIECDGHDFHERTKEQAQADKSRDRELQAAGYRVMRFTGSEVWRDAFACAGEVIWMAINEAMSVPEYAEVPS